MQVIQGSSVLFVIPADVVRRSAVLGAIVRQQEERYTSLDATQISDWISFPQVLPSQLLQLVSLLKARSLRCTKPNRTSRRGGVCAHACRQLRVALVMLSSELNCKLMPVCYSLVNVLRHAVFPGLCMLQYIAPPGYVLSRR